MNRRIETLLTSFFPRWALRRLQARQSEEAAKRKTKKPASRMFADRPVRENERRRYSDPYEW